MGTYYLEIHPETGPVVVDMQAVVEKVYGEKTIREVAIQWWPIDGLNVSRYIEVASVGKREYPVSVEVVIT